MLVKSKNDMKNGTAGNSIKQMFLMWLLPVLIVGCLAVTAGAQDFYSELTPSAMSSTWSVRGIEWQQADKKNPSAAITQDSSGALTLAGAAWTNGRVDSSGYGDGNGVQTVSTYNFLGKTVRLKFKANGPAGKYLRAVPHVAGLPSFGASTDHSWAGSTVIPDDVWVYVRYTFESGGAYDLAMATGNYDDQGGTLLSQDSGSLTSGQMADAKDTIVKMVYGDNYGGTASSLVLADAAIEDASDDVFVPQACAVTIDQNLNFTIPNAIYNGGPLVGQMALEIDFQYFGEQNGQLMWKLGDIGTPSSSSSSCSVTIEPDLSFTLANAVYDAGPLVGQTAFQAEFQFSGEQNGNFLWYLAGIKVDDTPSDPTPDPSPVVLSKTQVALESGNSETITVSGGTGYYTVNTSNSQVATAVISGNSIDVTGLSAGSTTITVKDSGGETANLSVTVSSPTTPSGNCGAYVAPGVWKQFDCYNLAAIGKTTNDDPFTPSWRLIGGYWQWGRKGPSSSQWYDTDTSNFAHGPTGPGSSEANEDFISNWDSINEAPDGSWSDSQKTANDPCPDGFRVPTKSQWEGVGNNNTQSTVGTWAYDYTNYNSALFFGSDLMLPAAGGRGNKSGGVALRGSFGGYWSSSEAISIYAWRLVFSSSGASTNKLTRRGGQSVRCVAE